MKHVDNIEDRADHLLQQIVKNGQRRDRLLNEVAALVRDHHALQGCLGTINEVRYQQLPQYVDRSAALAKTVEGSAALAERSSRRVKTLDALCSRVRATKVIAESMISMKETVAGIPAVLASGDLDKTVELLTSYERARQQLASRGSECTGSRSGVDGEAGPGVSLTATSSPSSYPAVDPLILQARRETSEKLTERAKAAMLVNDKLTIMKAAKLLAQLGLHKEGMELYCNWMCDHTIAALKKIVERELRKMESPTEAAMSHLALVSQALDTVAAAYEAEEEFTLDTFGHEGPLLLLTLLHERSTAECVPVLRNFIEKRKDTITSLQRITRGKNGNITSPSGSDDDDNDMDSEARDALRLIAETDQAERTSNAADARRADKTLEETSHLVSCCHIYLDFAESKRAEHVNALKKEHADRVAADKDSSIAAASGGGGGTEDGGSSRKDPKRSGQEKDEDASPIVSAADRLWSGNGAGGSNALLSVVQEILAMYVPLQNSYFEAAFQQAVQLQLQAIREGGKRTAAAAAAVSGGGGGTAAHRGSPPRGGGGGAAVAGGADHGRASPLPGAFPIDSTAALMAGITNIYAAALGGGGSEREAAITAAMELENSYYAQGGAITLPDDVFFFLRIAVHRALNTKSTQIASAVIMSATDVINSRLIPEIAKRAAPSKSWAGAHGGLSSSASSPPPPPTPRALRWACAAQQVVEYCRKLAQELRVTTGVTANAGAVKGQAALSTFSSRDVVRFRELAQDIEIAAKELKAAEGTWMTQDASRCTAYVAATSGHLERFATMSYNIAEETFYHYELNDPWVQAFLVDWSALLDYVASHLHEAGLFDLFLTEVARAVARRVRELILKKSFSTFGALQVDKDVRALREFFLHRAHEVSALREVFAALSLTSTLLLCDAPRDALEESHNTALTAEEKRAVLLLRVDFKRAEVLALKL